MGIVHCEHKGGVSLPAIQVDGKVIGPFAFQYGANAANTDEVKKLIAAHAASAIHFGKGGCLRIEESASAPTESASKAAVKDIEEAPKKGKKAE